MVANSAGAADHHAPPLTPFAAVQTQSHGLPHNLLTLLQPHAGCRLGVVQVTHGDPNGVKIIDLGASRAIGDTLYSVDMIQPRPPLCAHGEATLLGWDCQLRSEAHA